MPKSRQIDWTVPGSPEEVARRLKLHTRWRPFVMQSSMFGGGKRPLGGRVSARRFVVTSDERSPMQWMAAVARCDLEATPGGATRVRGEVGMPGAVVWYLRAAAILMALLVGAIPFLIASEGASGNVVAWSLLNMLLVLGLSVFAIGAHVNHADSQIPRVVEALQGALRGDTLQKEPVASSARGRSSGKDRVAE